MTNATDIPVACDMRALGGEERARHERLLVTLIAPRPRRALPDGVELTFPAEPEVMAAVARWMIDERRCCPFLSFELALDPGRDGARLRLRGPAGTAELLETVLGVPQEGSTPARASAARPRRPRRGGRPRAAT